MSSKEELYKLLLETSPYGTLFFAYGVCVDCNPSAQQMLGCTKRQLLGASLDETCPEDPISLATLKQCLQTALAEDKERTLCELRDKGDSERIEVNLRRVGREQKELVVTLFSAGAEKTLPSEGSTGNGVTGNDSQMPRGQQDGPAEPAAGRAETPAPPEKPEPRAPTEVLGDWGTIIDKLSGPRKTATGGSLPPHAVERDLFFDNLTQLPNRQLLIETIREYLEESAGQDIVAAVLMLDLDHFKDINDSWGHVVGDQVIRKIGRVLSRVATEHSMVARLSGDEFVMFIPNIAESLPAAPDAARAMAETVKELVSHPIFHEGQEFIMTASVGIALLTDTDTSPERALQYADTAMYEAKRKGRNGIAFFDPGISKKAQRQVGLNTKLRKAVDNQEFALYVQPQICIQTGRLVGGEALLRWINSERITNMPSEFIPLLESSGLIVNVGHWVIRTACEYIRSFIDDGVWEDHMQLGINISPRQFNDPQLLEVIEHSLKSYEIRPKYLNFEVTENLVIEDVEDAIRKMEAIKSLGSNFSIDDFGIGYSSMIYLKRLPFDRLKIDREFIRNIHRDPESRGVVEAIMAVSRQYGLHVTAEGVEDQDSLSVLRRVGCDNYQGAYYSMPVPVKRFKELLVA